MAKRPPQPRAPSGTLAVLVALGGVSALWAVFQWGELLVARAGGTTFCALSESFDCTAVWGSPVASAIHRYTGIPIAGWGLVWSLVATTLPLWALWRQSEDRPPRSLLSATRITAAAGVVATLGLAGVSLSAGVWCLGCIGTYVLVAAYTIVCTRYWKGVGLPFLEQGALVAGTLTVGFALVLLWPGLRTPRDASEAMREAMRALPAVPEGTPPQPARPADPPAAPADPHAPADLGAGPTTGDPERDRLLAQLVEILPPEGRQALADSLLIYLEAPTVPVRPPRDLHGSADAPILITDFVDIRCPHCADLHETLSGLKRKFPAGTFAVDSRHFPLESNCNPLMKRPPGDGLSCLAAQAGICVGTVGDAFEYAGKLFPHARELTRDKIIAMAEPWMKRDALLACVASEETKAKLMEDIEWAIAHRLHGTPLVLINGKKGTAVEAFLHAMLLTGGRAQHPAFSALPAPRADAHVH